MKAKTILTPDELEGRLYIRPKELASMIGIEATIIYRSIYNGSLPARKFRGSVWLIRREDANAWLEANLETAA